MHNLSTSNDLDALINEAGSKTVVMLSALAEWLREHNQHVSTDKKVGFYGLDVYSLWDSMEAMVNYLDKEDPKASLSVRNKNESTVFGWRPRSWVQYRTKCIDCRKR